jgi:hypothetical protein
VLFHFHFILEAKMMQSQIKARKNGKLLHESHFMKFSRFQKFFFEINKFLKSSHQCLSYSREFLDLEDELLEAAELHEVTFVSVETAHLQSSEDFMEGEEHSWNCEQSRYIHRAQPLFRASSRLK